jgi:hypothetical protein
MEGYDFNPEIKKLIHLLKGKNGVYFLMDESKEENPYSDEIIYIGKSNNLGNRMMQSFYEKNAFSFCYELTSSHIDCCIKELFYISRHKPKYNKFPPIIDDVKDYLPDLDKCLTQGPFYLDSIEDLKNGKTINDDVDFDDCLR